MGFINLDNIIKISLLVFLVLLIYYLVGIGNRYAAEGYGIKLTKGRIIRAVLLALIVITGYLFWTNFPIISDIFAIVIASLVFSYLLSPLVGFFERRLVGTRLPRGWAIIIVYAILIAAIAILIAILIPRLISELGAMIRSLPYGLSKLREIFDNFISNLAGGYYEGLINSITSEFTSGSPGLVSRIQVLVFDFLSSLPDKIPGLVSNVIILVLIPVVSFYLLYDRKKLIAKAKDRLMDHKQDKLIEIAEDLNIVMSDYIRGRLIMAAFVGVATAIVMFVMDIDFALVVGLITGIGDIIPYIGPFLGFLPAVIFALIESPVKAIIMGLAFVLIQWVENNILGPVVLSGRTGIHPVLVLFCILVGGSVGGILGMIFLLPIVVALKVIYKHIEPEVKAFVKKIFNI